MTVFSKSLLIIVKREFNRILRRKSISIPSLVLPCLLFLLFGMIYRNALVSGIPIAVIDNDNRELSITLTRYLESTSGMKIVSYPASFEEAKKEILRGKIDAVIVIPTDFEKNIKKGNNPVISFHINSSNLIKSNYLQNDGLKVIKTFSAGVTLKKLRSSGMMYEQAMARVNPVTVDIHPLFNSNYGYNTFLIPSISFFLLQTIILIVTALLISSEYTHNTFKELLESANSSITAIIAGKFIPHFLVHTANVLLLYYIIFPLFGVELQGSTAASILFSLIFIAVVLMFGMAISSLISKQMFATEVCLFITTPAFVLCGLTFPLWGMPPVIEFIANLIPFTHFVNGLLKVSYMGLGLSYIKHQVNLLLIFFLLGLAGSYLGIFIHSRKLKGNNEA